MEVVARDEQGGAAYVELVDWEGNFLRAAIPYPQVGHFSVGAPVEVRLRVVAHAARRVRPPPRPESRRPRHRTAEHLERAARFMRSDRPT